jgi:tRNA(adenine34) deaminase
MNETIQTVDHIYMKQALTLAQQAYTLDEVPIGALIVNAQGEIIGRGYNQVEQQKSQLAHAEMLAIAQATAAIGDWRLEGCIIYVTLEPCSMCFSAIQLSRIEKLVYGADSPRFGYQLDKIVTAGVYKKDVIICRGIYADQAQELVQRFFKKQRKKKGEYETGLEKDKAGIDCSSPGA